MLSAPSSDPHAHRLRALSSYFHNQERFMTNALLDLQAQLDSWQHATEHFDQQLREDLSQERDQLSIELSHVRLAIAGADEELNSHEGQRRLINDDCDEMHPTTAVYDSYELLGA